MLKDVVDLLAIDTHIKEIETRREEIAEKLQVHSKGYARFAGGSARSEQEWEQLADELLRDGVSLHGVAQLRVKYGQLKALDHLEDVLKNEAKHETALEELHKLKNNIEDLAVPCDDVIALAELNEQIKFHTGIPEVSVITELFNSKIAQTAEPLMKDFKHDLLQSQWDRTQTTLNHDQRHQLHNKFVTLHQLSNLHIDNGSASKRLWGLEALAHNFNVRFIYHFHKVSQNMIEVYFKFLNDYLNDNLAKCINLFHDDLLGISKSYLHEQFIHHILQPIRDKVAKTLRTDDPRTAFVLISQIISTDKLLNKSFHYKGVGLIALVPAEVWEYWVLQQISNYDAQYQAIVSSGHNLEKSAIEFTRLIQSAYESLKPFYHSDYENLQQYKLKTSSDIFMNLFTSFLDHVLTIDELREGHTKEDELYQTMTKLQSLHIVRKKIRELENKRSFLNLTLLVNELESKKFCSLFQTIQLQYKTIIDSDVQNSLINRIKRLIKESFTNYFKVGNWTMTEFANADEDKLQPRAEIVNTINLVNKIFTRFDALDTPLEVGLRIKNEIVNIIVNYFVESILKLNKFSKIGLEQLWLDFTEISSGLRLPDSIQNSQFQMFEELLRVLRINYEPDTKALLTMEYVKNNDFSDLRYKLDIKSLTDSEIGDALYRVLYGNII